MRCMSFLRREKRELRELSTLNWNYEVKRSSGSGRGDADGWDNKAIRHMESRIALTLNLSTLPLLSSSGLMLKDMIRAGLPSIDSCGWYPSTLKQKESNGGLYLSERRKL